MLGLLAASLAAAIQSSAPASPAPATASTPVLESAVPWWERITVTVDDAGKQQSCLYEMSLSAAGAGACDKDLAASVKVGGDGRRGVFSKVTFERRFSPGGRLDGGRLQPGDKLLGRKVMFLTFDEAGAIQSCNIVATTGETVPGYNCDEVKKEQFRAAAGAARPAAARQAFLTVLAYGHKELIA